MKKQFELEFDDNRILQSIEKRNLKCKRKTVDDACDINNAHACDCDCACFIPNKYLQSGTCDSN